MPCLIVRAGRRNQASNNKHWNRNSSSYVFLHHIIHKVLSSKERLCLVQARAKYTHSNPDTWELCVKLIKAWGEWIDCKHKNARTAMIYGENYIKRPNRLLRYIRMNPHRCQEWTEHRWRSGVLLALLYTPPIDHQQTDLYWELETTERCQEWTGNRWRSGILSLALRNNWSSGRWHRTTPVSLISRKVTTWHFSLM